MIIVVIINKSKHNVSFLDLTVLYAINISLSILNRKFYQIYKNLISLRLDASGYFVASVISMSSSTYAGFNILQ